MSLLNKTLSLSPVRLLPLCALLLLVTAHAAALPTDESQVLTFSSDSEFTLSTAQNGWDGTLYFSTDLKSWATWNGTQISSSNGKLYLCGAGNTKITGDVDYNDYNDYKWSLSGSQGIACNGNIENLLDYEAVARGEHPYMADGCYSYMFSDCTSLTSAPSLPATTLAGWCYSQMFSNCTGLTSAPSLPATTLADFCYSDMFSDCTGLTSAPSLPATTLAGWCYSKMFSDCTGLTSAPSLPATTLADFCYSDMFWGCTGLTSAPSLPATTLARGSYSQMFSNCTGLTSAPSLPATTLAEECYNWMFSGCTSLIISDKKTDDHPYEWRIPSVGDISELPDGWNEFMLSYTGGPFTSAPQANTTYYLATAPQTTSLPTLEAPAPSLIATPNPAHGSVTISGLPAGKVQVFDAAGRLVLSVQTDGSDSQTIDISGLAPGVHIVRAGSQSARLMVM